MKLKKAITILIFALGTLSGCERELPTGQTSQEELEKVNSAEIKELSTAEREKIISTAVNSLSKKDEHGNFFIKSHDAFEKITFYLPNHDKYRSSKIESYIAISDSPKKSPDVRWNFIYSGSDWLYFNNVKILVDENLVYDQSHDDIFFDRSVTGDSILEQLDLSVSNSEFEVMKLMSSGKKVIIRYDGEHGYDDHEVTTSEKSNLRRILDAHKALEKLYG